MATPVKLTRRTGPQPAEPLKSTLTSFGTVQATDVVPPVAKGAKRHGDKTSPLVNLDWSTYSESRLQDFQSRAW